MWHHIAGVAVYPGVSKAASAVLLHMNPLRIALIAIAAVGLGVFLWFRGAATLQYLHHWAEGLNGSLLFVALTVLPLFGFPVSVLHAATGARFGLPIGLTLVGISIALQLLASYAVVQLAPEFFARRFDWLRKRLPPATHRSLTLFTMLLPGAPYFAQNYVLVVAGVPFQIFFLYSFAIHFGRSIVGVIFGEWSGDMTPARVALLAVYGIGVTLACGLAFRRLRAQLQSPRRAAGGRTPRG